jgi:hypothetical protein
VVLSEDTLVVDEVGEEEDGETLNVDRSGVLN